VVLPCPGNSTGALWQKQGIIEWIHLEHTPSRVITPYCVLVARIIGQVCFQCVQLVGQEPGSMTIPFSKEQQNWLWQFSEMWQNALANFPGQLNEHLSTSKILHFVSTHSFMFPHWKTLSLMPLLYSQMHQGQGLNLTILQRTIRLKKSLFSLLRNKLPCLAP
jgi:hypothetical protein